MGSTEQAREKFERWQECRSILDKQTRILQKDMRDFLAGKSPMPTDLLAEVLELQKKCVALFDEVCKAMKKP
jgi:hypothetical protein